MKGRIKESLSFWRNTLQASDFVLSIIENGYRLPFSNYPSRCFLRNNLSALKHKQFVADAISELLSHSCIIEHEFPPYCINPLTVAEGKKLRLVIDLRHVNAYLVKPKFKYEDLRSLSQVIEGGYWFFTWDLKSGYHHIDISVDHQQYLGFSWEYENGLRRYFTFTVLPFGLSTACFCFTKVLRPFVKRWRSMGHLSFIYLDDGFCGAPDKISAQAASIVQRKELRASGLLCNEEKSVWDPAQTGEWLGFIINTISMKFYMPERKVAKLKATLQSAISDGYCSYRYLAKIAGSVMSCALAVGPMARLLTRQMYLNIETRGSWDSVVQFSPGLLEELRFWFTNIDCFNGHRISEPVTTCTVIFTDASESGFGGFSATIDGAAVSGMWTQDDIGSSSTHRELKAIYFVCLSYLDQLRGKKVKFFTDNQGAARIVSIGSSKPELQQIAMAIFNVCLINCIQIEAQWIPREANIRADILSRFIDADDWSINTSVFQMLNSAWGPYTVDRFASYYNSQLAIYNSKYSSPGSSGVDAFSQDWSSSNNWLCPPVHLIVATVKKLKVSRGQGTLIIPEWPSGLFWPYLHSSGLVFKSYVKECTVLPRLHDLIIEGPGQSIMYSRKDSIFSGCPRFNMLALRLDFTDCL